MGKRELYGSLKVHIMYLSSSISFFVYKHISPTYHSHWHIESQHKRVILEVLDDKCLLLKLLHSIELYYAYPSLQAPTRQSFIKAPGTNARRILPSPFDLGRTGCSNPDTSKLLSERSAWYPEHASLNA